VVPQAVSSIPDVGRVWEELPRLKKFLVNHGQAIFIGKYTESGSSDELEFFLFKCPRCQELNINYRHGFNQYLPCHHCK